MSDNTRREPIQTSTPTPTEASFLGGILRKGETIEGWVVESKIQVASGEAELYIANKNGQTAVVKYYRQNVVPKEEILAKLAAFKHEDIIQLLAYGTYNGLFYEVMEFAAGGGLDSRDAAGKSKYLPLDEGQVIQMVREVNNAYKACHAIGIIHRDIKPANIFLRNTNGMDYVIGDFGISSLLDVEGELSKRLTRNASRTEGYAAPEIYSGVVGSEVDYYALGVTVWEVMTGLNAFEGRNTQFIIRDTMEGRIADDLITRAEAKGFSPRLQTLIRGLLTHRHDKRWGYQQIEDWLAGKDVEVFAAPMLAAIPPFTFEGKKFETAAALAVELLAQPEKAQKYLYRGLIEGWLAGFDQAMAMEVGDIKEGLGDSEAGKVRAVRRVALLLNPGQPMVSADGASMDSIGAFKRVLETRPESLVDHLRNPGDALWDFLESWGAGELASSMRESIAGEKSQKRVVNLITVALSGKVIRPFEGTRFAGTELSRIEQLEGLPVDLRKRLLMELEDANGLLAVWLEMTTGKPYPNRWSEGKVPGWKYVVKYWTDSGQDTQTSIREDSASPDVSDSTPAKPKVKKSIPPVAPAPQGDLTENNVNLTKNKPRPRVRPKTIVKILILAVLISWGIFVVQTAYSGLERSNPWVWYLFIIPELFLAPSLLLSIVLDFTKQKPSLWLGIRNYLLNGNPTMGDGARNTKGIFVFLRAALPIAVIAFLIFQFPASDETGSVANLSSVKQDTNTYAQTPAPAPTAITQTQAPPELPRRAEIDLANTNPNVNISLGSALFAANGSVAVKWDFVIDAKPMGKEFPGSYIWPSGFLELRGYGVPDVRVLDFTSEVDKTHFIGEYVFKNLNGSYKIWLYVSSNSKTGRGTIVAEALP